LKVVRNVHNCWFSCDVIKIPKGKLRPPQRCSFRDGPLEKFFGGEGGGIFELHKFFSLTFPSQDYFFPYARSFFFWVTRCALIFFPVLIFPCMNFFLVLRPPHLHNFSNGPQHSSEIIPQEKFPAIYRFVLQIKQFEI